MNATQPVRYRIAALNCNAHLFEVRCTLDDPDPQGNDFRLPAWIPGSYLIREFARHFVVVRAETEGRAVGIIKTAKDVWRTEPCVGAVTVIAHVYAYDLSVRAAYLDSTRGYFNGAAVFLCVEGRAERACQLEIVAPSEPCETRWRVATTLSPATTSAEGFGLYRAANYDELIDHPVEMSDFASASFEAGGAAHQVAISGCRRADLDRMTHDLRRICQWHCDLFGGAPASAAPFDRYLFQIVATTDAYGGLEHRSSTSLICKRDELPEPGLAKITPEYRRFLGLASHEYFHAWMVKRIKPAAFSPYDLSCESYTRQLWAFEGITSYYDDLALVRSGVIDAPSYLELLGRSITSLLRTPGRYVQSIAESSFDAWVKYYRQDENTPNAVVSYYVKGSLVALALDLTLRRHNASLDVVIRTLWQRFGMRGIGVPEDEIARICSDIAHDDLSDFFARYVHGTDDLPLEALFAHFGIVLNLRAAENTSDAGGTASKAADEQTSVSASLNVRLAAGPEARLQHVYSGGAAERAGLAAGDVLIAFDGLRASPDSLPKMLAQRRAGDSVRVHAFRRDELFITTVTLDEAPLDTCWLSFDDRANETARTARAQWLEPIVAKPAASTA